MTNTSEIETTTLAATQIDSEAMPRPTAVAPISHRQPALPAAPATLCDATETQGTTPSRPRTMGRRVRYSFDIDLTPADIEKDLFYGRD